jgi:hypothetical protein
LFCATYYTLLAVEIIIVTSHRHTYELLVRSMTTLLLSHISQTLIQDGLLKVQNEQLHRPPLVDGLVPIILLAGDVRFFLEEEDAVKDDDADNAKKLLMPWEEDDFGDGRFWPDLGVEDDNDDDSDDDTTDNDEYCCCCCRCCCWRVGLLFACRLEDDSRCCKFDGPAAVEAAPPLALMEEIPTSLPLAAPGHCKQLEL